MTVIGPYRLLRTLGGGDAGKVWSAFAADGTSVTVAMIDPARASDPRWMYQFQSGTNELVRDGVVEVLQADLSSPTPWVACAWDSQSVAASILFTAQGLTYFPAGVPQPAQAAPAKLSRRQAKAEQRRAATTFEFPATVAAQAAAPAAAQPQISQLDAPTVEVPVIPQPRIEPQGPPPALDSSIMGQPPVALPPPVAPPSVAAPSPVMPPPAPVVRGRGIADPDRMAAAPVGPDQRGPGSSRPGRRRRRRRGRTILVVVVVVLALLGGGAFAAVRTGVVDRFVAEATPPPAATTKPADIRGPGIEPPLAGNWPLYWPKLAEADRTRLVKDLVGVGFNFRIFATWGCVQGTPIRNAAHYICRRMENGAQIGGEIEVRPCPDPCDAAQRAQMRQASNAWHLQWTKAGDYFTWAETSTLPAPSSYAIVFLGYWHSTPNGPLDRQVVVRMIAPPVYADEVQKISNDIFDAVNH